MIEGAPPGLFVAEGLLYPFLYGNLFMKLWFQRWELKFHRWSIAVVFGVEISSSCCSFFLEAGGF